jgi:hypothetical protein
MEAGVVIDRRSLFLPLAALALGSPAIAAPRWRAPRTALGAPDVEGYWTTSSYTELERPDAFKTLVAPPDEARKWEAKLARTGGVNVPQDPLGQAQTEFPETGSGLMRIRGEARTSWIVDPADGKIPYSEAGKKRLHIGEKDYRRGYDNVEVRPLEERCLNSGASGAPILPSPDANVLQIVQTRDAVLILTERYHDARIIHLGPVDPAPRSWLGTSVGRWEGDTLVVHTEGFRDAITERGDELRISGETRVDERFTRTGPGEIRYEFTVTDPTLFSAAWRCETVLTASRARLFEYACHEGNYSLTSILSAARQGNQPGPPKPAEGEAAKATN